MAVNVLVWNIKTFGNRLVGDPNGISITHNLIAAMILDLDADVVLIQELRTAGVGWLANLCDLLGPSWKFDWVKGGITAGIVPSRITFADTAFAYNSEGYAVLWRGNVLAPVITLPHRSAGVGNTNRHARDGNAFIDLCLRGYAIDVMDQLAEPTIRQDPVARVSAQVSGYPTHCGAASSSRIRRGVVTWKHDGDVQVQHGSRRAAYVSVQVGPNRFDVVTYHGPNADHATLYGPIIALNAVTANHDQKVVAGDFNTNVTNYRRLLATTAVDPTYEQMRSPLIAPADGSCPSHGSMVHESDDHRWRLGDGIYTTHRDFAFLRGNGAGGNAVVPDLRPFFYNPANRLIPGGASALYNRILALTENILNQLKGPMQFWYPETRDSVGGDEVIRWYFECLTSYNRTPASDLVLAKTHVADFNTAIALLYGRYISDHLPVQLKLV